MTGSSGLLSPTHPSLEMEEGLEMELTAERHCVRKPPYHPPLHGSRGASRCVNTSIFREDDTSQVHTDSSSSAQGLTGLARCSSGCSRVPFITAFNKLGNVSKGVPGSYEPL